MAADARLLMRAAAAESSSEGIKDRFANYHPKTRALRCTACDYLTIKHESLWPSHAASKSHRSNIARIRREEEEAIEAERAKAESSSRHHSADTRSTGNKRKGEANNHDVGPSEETQKRTRTDGVSEQQEGVPVDAEWERFQREVLNAAPAAEAAPPLSAYADATIEVAPALKAGVNGVGLDDGEGEEEGAENTTKKVETEAEKRIRLERENREEIIARLEEEQRLQDEADERVSALRSRFERLKQARANKKK